MSDLQDIHEAYAAQGVRIYALNVPAFSEDAQTLAAFKEQAGLTYPLLHHQGTIGLIDFQGSNGFPYPRDVIVDQQGVIVYTSNSYDAQGMLSVIEQLLAAE